MATKVSATARKKTSNPARQPGIKQRLDKLADDRNQRIDLIEALRRSARTKSKLLEDAYRLLTGLHWSRASCNQRGELLKTADWLFGLERRARARLETGMRANTQLPLHRRAQRRQQESGKQAAKRVATVRALEDCG